MQCRYGVRYYTPFQMFDVYNSRSVFKCWKENLVQYQKTVGIKKPKVGFKINVQMTMVTKY